MNDKDFAYEVALRMFDTWKQAMWQDITTASDKYSNNPSKFAEAMSALLDQAQTHGAISHLIAKKYLLGVNGSIEEVANNLKISKEMLQ